MKIPRFASLSRVFLLSACALGLAVAFWACSNEESALAPADSPVAELSARVPEFAKAVEVHNRAIARMVGVSHQTVANLRRAQRQN